MSEKIKQLADEAIALQNKDRMDAALREISALCSHAPLGDAGIAASRLRSLRASDAASYSEVSARVLNSVCQTQLADAEVLKSMNTGFGMAHVKQEGCAIHPDDTDADMTDEQRAAQLAAYSRDQATDKKAKKGRAK